MHDERNKNATPGRDARGTYLIRQNWDNYLYTREYQCREIQEIKLHV